MATIMSEASPFTSLDPSAPACREQRGTVSWYGKSNLVSEMQVVWLTLLKTKHFSLMILDSSLSIATSTTRVSHTYPLYTLCNTILHNYNAATPVDGSPTIEEEPSLGKRIKGNTCTIALH